MSKNINDTVGNESIAERAKKYYETIMAQPLVTHDYNYEIAFGLESILFASDAEFEESMAIVKGHQQHYKELCEKTGAKHKFPNE